MEGLSSGPVVQFTAQQVIGDHLGHERSTMTWEILNRGCLAKIGVIGDVHAEATHLRAALEFLQSMQLQALLCVGDIVDGKESVNVCCELLTQYQVITVCGNRDRWFLANVARTLPEATQLLDVSQTVSEFLSGLPSIKELTTVTGRLLLCHGLGADDMGHVTPEDFGYGVESNEALQKLMHSQYRFVINGHTHRRMVRAFGRLTVINAGTLKRDQEPCCMIVDFGRGEVQFYDIEETLTIKEGERYDL